MSQFGRGYLAGKVLIVLFKLLYFLPDSSYCVVIKFS